MRNYCNGSVIKKVEYTRAQKFIYSTLITFGSITITIVGLKIINKIFGSLGEIIDKINMIPVTIFAGYIAVNFCLYWFLEEKLKKSGYENYSNLAGLGTIGANILTISCIIGGIIAIIL